jgi:hypothetical protein
MPTGDYVGLWRYGSNSPEFKKRWHGSRVTVEVEVAVVFSSEI